MRPDFVWLGGFDSHAFPPRAVLRLVAIAALALATLAMPRAANAQDTLATLLSPPMSPKRAFLTSVLIPGLAQAQLDRPMGFLFVATEALALTMYGKSRRDLEVARSFGRDSTPTGYSVDPLTGALTATGWELSKYTNTRTRARKTHVEDWIAVLVFNHLLAGADAFVAAQLWDLPAQVSLEAGPGRTLITARIPW